MSETQEGLFTRSLSDARDRSPAPTRLNQTGEFMELEGPEMNFRHSWIQENICHSLMLSGKLPVLG